VARLRADRPVLSTSRRPLVVDCSAPPGAHVRPAGGAPMDSLDTGTLVDHRFELELRRALLEDLVEHVQIPES